ncbi:MAG: type 1 glutamine amidotransferase [Gammaproteobacteria bacterium]|nr:type 1 glutamine amidotransferase [Gammaproteobacteria bacterium]MDH5592869.1 type 1 glutamine amidotransferase [Gammaproteobacteria bacterium]
MKPVRIFRHLACEGPGYLGEFLIRNNIPYEVVCIDEGVAVPETCDDVSGLIFMGGSMSVNDSLDWIEKETALIKEATEKNMPVLGICLGSQLIAKALGAKVYPGANGQEIGWHPVHAVKGEEKNAWIAGIDFSNEIFHWHGDTFELPENATLLLSSDCYPNQAFVVNNTLGIQFHLEMMQDMVDEWNVLYQCDIEKGRDCTQSSEEINRDLENRIRQLHKVADVVYSAWIKCLA